MHDRRIDGEIQVFGNAGALFMTAMTWYDHNTESIWSQPWGRAIIGDLKGVQLELLPSQVTTWSSWKSEHPDTLVMINDLDRLSGRREGFYPDMVVGLLLANQGKAYYFEDVTKEILINDFIGDIPVFVWAEGNVFHAYIRQVGEKTLTFNYNQGVLSDQETGTIWDVSLGLAIEGPLSGEGLQPVPSTTAYDWAWVDFYPDFEIYSK